MGKLALLVLLFTVLVGLAAPADAQEGTDWNWYIFMQAGNNTWNNLTRTWGCAGAELLLGCKPYPYKTAGPPFAGTAAYVRDLSDMAAGFGYSTNSHVPVYRDFYTWTNIRLWAGASYGSSKMYLRIWGRSMDYLTPRIVLSVDRAKPGSGFAAGQIIFDSRNDNILTEASKRYPSLTVDLSPYISVIKSSTWNDPAVVFTMTAYANPGGLVPEPGSMLAIFTGLAGVGGFARLRRRQ